MSNNNRSLFTFFFTSSAYKRRAQSLLSPHSDYLYIYSNLCNAKKQKVEAPTSLLPTDFFITSCCFRYL